MLAAGCIPFVPADGGPAEIVEHNSNLTYETLEDAVTKIDAMLTDPALERDTRASMLRRADDFSTVAFGVGIRRMVGEFIKSEARNRSAAAAEK
jgi:hypothetical protein